MSDNNLQVFIEMRQSQRLMFRQLGEDDFDFFFKLHTDEQVMKYAYDDCFVSDEEAKTCFEQVLQRQIDIEKGTQFIVLIKESLIPIGIVDFSIETLHPSGGIYEVGYFILPEFWGQGYATEMALSMMNHLFENFNVHKVTGSCHRDNKASEGIMTKIGMIQEGVLRKERFKDRLWVDEIKFGMLREEWEARL